MNNFDGRFWSEPGFDMRTSVCLFLFSLIVMLLASMAYAIFGRPELIIFILIIIFCMPLAYAVHCGLDYCCVRHGRRFCRRNGLDVRRLRAGMAFDQSGVKTEFTIVELDCLDGQKQRKLVRLLVWVFGIRRVLSDEIYPDSYAEQWPQKSG
jgi:hypothetical protein